MKLLKFHFNNFSVLLQKLKLSAEGYYLAEKLNAEAFSFFGV